MINNLLEYREQAGPLLQVSEHLWRLLYRGPGIAVDARRVN